MIDSKGMLLWMSSGRLKIVPAERVVCGGFPPGLIVFRRLSVSTSFVRAALRALHVDSSYAAEGMAGVEEGWGLSRAV